MEKSAENLFRMNCAYLLTLRAQLECILFRLAQILHRVVLYDMMPAGPVERTFESL